jgi:hypothetical protein
MPFRSFMTRFPKALPRLVQRSAGCTVGVLCLPNGREFPLGWTLMCSSAGVPPSNACVASLHYMKGGCQGDHDNPDERQRRRLRGAVDMNAAAATSSGG